MRLLLIKYTSLFACMNGHYLIKDIEWRILEVRLNVCEEIDSHECGEVLLASLVWDIAFTQIIPFGVSAPKKP